MKIHLKNFGPIHDFEFDLEKDFHVIYGENNIGKSYAMSAIYLILKNLPREKPSFMSSLKNETVLNRLCSKVDEEIIKGDKKEILITSYYIELLKQVIQELLISKIEKSFINSLSGNFNNLKNHNSNNEINIFLQISSKIKINLVNKKNKLIISKITGFENRSIKVKIRSLEDNASYSSFTDGSSIYYRKKINDLVSNNESFRNDIRGDTYETYFWLFSHVTQNSDIYFLPASRSGLYEGMNSLSSVFAELSQFRYQINQKIEIPALPEPIADYFLNISTIQVKNQENIYQEFAEKIEQKLLKAKIVFNENTKKLEYVSSDISLKLNLSETSSMVSEIAPIVAHLKYLMSREDEDKYKIIFIEEPEAHLHPKIQVLLTEIFLELTKHKVKIVMTTHSNYIFNKINNLLLRKSIETDKIAVYHMIDTKKGSIVSEDSKPSEYGISDHNFAETSEQLYQERLDISDEWN